MKKSELIKLLNDIDGDDPEILDGEERPITMVLDWIGNTIMIESDYKSNRDEK